tara:strand:- start:5808 stop:7835 length:2028 start_codon:yes stop_codon:yes gene_type:complete
MNDGRFELTKNAFHVLKAGYDSSRSDIAELVDDAEFDGVFEPEQIQSAQQSLLAPNARLEQEISWLPELSQAQISNVLSLITSGDLAALIESSKHAPELAKANFLAHFSGTGNVNDSLFHALVAAWDEVDQATILTFVNENRLSAGFPGAGAHQMRDALKDLEKLHARTAAFGIWTLDRPGEVMDRIVEAELRRHPSSSFLEQFVRHYDTLSERDLVRISDEIDKVISDAEKDGVDLSVLVTAASDLLVRWDDVNQPVQVYEQHQGHEEGRSKKIYEKLRSLSLELHNNRGETAEARRLSEALLRTFPELESVAEVLKSDVAQLESMDKKNKRQKLVRPLITACHVAKLIPNQIGSELKRNGFSKSASGALSEIFETFSSAISTIDDVSIPFSIVRDLALDLNNEKEDPETAFRLIDALLAYKGVSPSQELIEKLEEERAVLHYNWKSNELEQCRGNFPAMSRIIDEMLKYARDSKRAELLQLKSKLEPVIPKFRQMGNKPKPMEMGMKPKPREWGENLGTALANLVLAIKRVITWVLYATIVVLLGWLLIEAVTDKPSNRSTYQPAAPRVATPTPAPAAAPAAAVETRPPVGQGFTLNRSQIRYCVFQGQRLEIIRTLANTNYQIDRFNGLIDDLNARCSNYRYQRGDLSSVRREMQDKATELRADARRIFSSW